MQDTNGRNETREQRIGSYINNKDIKFTKKEEGTVSNNQKSQKIEKN